MHGNSPLMDHGSAYAFGYVACQSQPAHSVTIIDGTPESHASPRVTAAHECPAFTISLNSGSPSRAMEDWLTDALLPCRATHQWNAHLTPAIGTAAAVSCIHHAGSVALADNCTDRCTPACLFTPRTHPQAAQFTCNLDDLALHALQHQPHPNRSIRGSVVPTSSQHHPLPTIAPSSATPSPHHNLGSRGSSAAEPSCMQMT